MSNPKISVIIPVYNVEKYLSECLDSIVNQTLRDIEIICVNDGSTDNSLSILKEYASKDKRIKIIDKENEGQGYARKVGLDIANGDYILFCDSDDYYIANDVFENLYDEIKKNDSELMFFRFLSGNSKSNLLDDYINRNFKRAIFFHFSYPPWCKIYKRKFLDKYTEWCFPKYLKFQDVPFHIQCCLRAKNISFSKIRGYYYRLENPNNITNSKKGKKHVENICDIVLLVYNILQQENKVSEYSKEFTYLAVDRIKSYFDFVFIDKDTILKVKKTFDQIKCILNKVILLEYNILISKNNFPCLSKDSILFYKSFIRLDIEELYRYINGKRQKELISLKYQLKLNNQAIVNRDNTIKNRNYAIEQKNNEIQNLHNQIHIQELSIKRLQHSWSYRIGRLFTYPLSIPLEFYKFIRDYNLLKKSDLFDSEYYLSQNEDVKKAKMNPIKHYLKFGWKEGRNPSAEFNGNEYLNKRPDVRVAGICPLVHYIRFGKEEK